MIVPMPERSVEVSLRTGTPKTVHCPFCNQPATIACPVEDGFWYVAESCAHCRGISSTGRWDFGAIIFKGAMVRVAECRCGVTVEYSKYTTHKKQTFDPSEHCIVSDEWRDQL